MWELIAAAIAVAGSIASTVYQNKSNKSLMAQQQDWNESMLDKQNDWNTDSERIARAEEAGINPMSLYMGQGSTQFGYPSSSVNPASIIPSADVLGGASSSLVSLSQSFLNGANTKTENALRASRVKSAETQNKLWLSEIDSMNLDNASKQIALKYTDMLYQWELKGRQMDYRLHGRELARMNKEIEKMTYELEKILPEELLKIISERNINVLDLERLTGVIKNLDADTRYKISQAALSDVQVGTEYAKQNNLNAGADLSANQADLTAKEVEYYSRLTERIINKYDEEIGYIAAQTGKTKEETYWMVFDKVENTSIELFGNRISRNRFGERKYKKPFKDAVQSRVNQSN